MDTNDRNEIKEILNDILSGHNARTESAFEIINIKLDLIKEQTVKHNSRLTKAEDRLIVLEGDNKTHQLRCPQINKFESIQSDITLLKKDLDGKTSVRTFLIKSISLVGVIAAITVAVIKLIEFL